MQRLRPTLHIYTRPSGDGTLQILLTKAQSQFVFAHLRVRSNTSLFREWAPPVALIFRTLLLDSRILKQSSAVSAITYRNHAQISIILRKSASVILPRCF